MKTELSLHERHLTLSRFPPRNNETLQAWDAGDEYLINYVEDSGLPADSHILVLNDSFGALSCWFSDQHRVTMMSDSYIAHQATLNNLQHNHCAPVTLLSTLDAIPDDVDLVIMQIPRNNRHLVWQLSQLRQHLPTSCQVIAVNKAKEIHTSTLKLFEKYLGTTTTSLAWKKHRLVFSQPDSQVVLDVSPDTRWQVENSDITLNNLPNVYSGESLDQGARFLLPHLPNDEKLEQFIDLGCGNGVLSVRMGQLNPQARITCVDESFMATESARQNLQSNLQGERNVSCITNNCLDGFEANSTQLVVCNPPFHQQQAITDHIAWQMFCDSKHVLSKGGKLLVIGNRHLGYDVKLTRLFGRSQVKTVASNKKFVILQAIKQ
ncbi:methyltransferase [Vibrio sp. CDRSL-10 TSBA]